ncbi:ATP-binding protein [Streptomyces caviscabies]
MNAQLPTSAPGVLIGRSALLDDVCAEFDRRPAVVVITGEAGVGKSRLVRELLGRTTPPGAVTLIARCQESDGPSFPFAPIIEAIGSSEALAAALPAELPMVTGALRGLLPGLAGHLPPAPPPL